MTKYYKKILILIFFICLSTINSFAQNFKKKDIIFFLKADIVEYDDKEEYIEASGNISILSNDYIVNADKIFYDIKNDEIYAIEGVITFQKTGDVIKGAVLYFKDKFKQILIKELIFKTPNNSILIAKFAQQNDKINKLTNATYTACKICDNFKPIWSISAKQVDWDMQTKKIIYKNAFFELYGIKIFFIPYFFHPSPDAPAQSGILLPIMQEKRIAIPLYWRIRPNIDATFTPKISSKATLYDFQFRHLLNSGKYLFNISFLKDSIKKENSSGQITKKQASQYYTKISGNFYDMSRVKYNFDLKKTSNDCFLKNYLQDWSPYLTSNITVEKAHESDFFRIRMIYLQDLRNSSRQSIAILPVIDLKNVIYLTDYSTFSLYNNIISYNQNTNTINRISTTMSLDRNFNVSNNFIKLTLLERLDLYYIDKENIGNIFMLVRNNPEFQVQWKHPFTLSNSLLIEPQSVFFLGKNNKRNIKFNLIDAESYNLNEHNLYSGNHYSGYDWLEYGKRISSGVNVSYAMHNYYISSFIGISSNISNKIMSLKKNGLVGKFSINKLNFLDIYYRFYKGAKLQNLYSEVGISYYLAKNIYLNTNINTLNLQKKTSSNIFNDYNRKLTQSTTMINYHLNDMWNFGYSVSMDLSKKNNIKIMNSGIWMTYIKDCVTISANINQNFLNDMRRGILKTKFWSFSVGLKTLNI